MSLLAESELMKPENDQLYIYYTQKAQEADGGEEQQNYIEAAEKRLLKLQSQGNSPRFNRKIS